MSERKPVGVLVGVQPHGLGELILHAAHHVDAHSLDEDSTRRSSARSRGSEQAHERKGYHTFCCGDVVQCTVCTQSEGMVAAVLGVVVAVVGTQMRRLLVLCEKARKQGRADDASKMSFFVSTRAGLRRNCPRILSLSRRTLTSTTTKVCVPCPSRTYRCNADGELTTRLAKLAATSLQLFVEGAKLVII
eukprot:5188377-Pleurochrysis_carterae.AAC.1